MIRNLLALIIFSMLAPPSAPRFVAPANGEASQATTGTVQGQVTDPTGATVAGASVTLSNSITNYKVSAKTDDTGGFRIQNVPFNSYQVTVTAPEFQPSDQTIDLHSAVPVQLAVQLSVKALAAEVNVKAEDSHMIEAYRTGSDTDLNTPMLMKQLGAERSSGLEKMVESAPGIVADDNGRYHARGSESSVQTVINGVPVTENMSAIFATSLDPRTASHVEVLTGGIPAEFGDKLGAVVN